MGRRRRKESVKNDDEPLRLTLDREHVISSLFFVRFFARGVYKLALDISYYNISSSSKPIQALMSDQTRQKRVSDASIPGFFIPRNKNQWVRLYNASGLKNRTIQDLEVMELASRCTDSQYIAVRSIAITRKPKWFLRNLDKFGLEEAKKKADEMLARSSNFASFLKLIRENNSLQSLRGELDEDWQGAWRAVRSLHEQIVWKRPPVERADAGHTTSDSRLDTVKPPIKDEAVTNAAIITYLDTTADLRLIEAANNSQWVHNHVDMGARFHSRPEGRYVAKVDGVLWTRKKEVQALVEVKKHRRAHDFSATVKEETCQMAGFLKNVKNSHLPLNGQ